MRLCGRLAAAGCVRGPGPAALPFSAPALRRCLGTRAAAEMALLGVAQAPGQLARLRARGWSC